MTDIASKAETLFQLLVDEIKRYGRPTHDTGGIPYRWQTDDLEHGSFARSPAGPYDWIRSNHNGKPVNLYVYRRPTAPAGSTGWMQRIDFRQGDTETLEYWLQRLGVLRGPEAERQSANTDRKKVFLACPVRGADQSVALAYVAKLEANGIGVYYPTRDTPQDDPGGLDICETNLGAIQECDEFHIIWDGQSQGVLFDFGMAFALGKPIVSASVPPLTVGKSFQNVMNLYHQRYGNSGRPT